MTDDAGVSGTIDGPATCAVCDEYPTGGWYVYADEPSGLVFCSESCLRDEVRERRRQRWTARLRSIRRLSLVAAMVAAFQAPHSGPPGSLRAQEVAGQRSVSSPPDLGPEILPPGWYGPEWPPTETSSLAALGRDAWVHPLPGPLRRMPRADSRVFGAVRPGDRPIECRNGHCGVDLGGEIWGEYVHAVHDGVVDRVQRGANPDHGGRYVRLSHRNGTLFSQYFHLAAIPPALVRGKTVRSGELIGLLGDSGVKDSAAHLHFTISIRPWRDGPEKYIDPEPLVALWPLRIPIDGSEVGLVTTVAEPAVPLGSALLKRGKKRKAEKRGRAADVAVEPDGPAPAEPTSDPPPDPSRDSNPGDAIEAEPALGD